MKLFLNSKNISTSNIKYGKRNNHSLTFNLDNLIYAFALDKDVFSLTLK